MPRNDAAVPSHVCSLQAVLIAIAFTPSFIYVGSFPCLSLSSFDRAIFGIARWDRPSLFFFLRSLQWAFAA
jgi:hypothetical protein